MLDTRRSRFAAASCLALCAVVAGFVVWTAEQRRVVVLTRERVAEERLDRLVSLAADLDARAAAITETDAPAEPAIARFEETMAQSDVLTAALRRDALPETVAVLQEFEQTARALEQAVAGLRRRVTPVDPPASVPTTSASSADDAEPATGDAGTNETTASETSASPAETLVPASPGARPPGLATLGPEVRRVRVVHRTAFAGARAELLDRSWSAAVAVAAIWGIGLLALVWLPRARTADTAPPDAARAPSPRASPVERVPANRPIVPARDGSTTAAVGTDADFAATLRTCREIARLSSLDDLPDLLGRAAAPLGASGLMLWSADGHRLVPWIAYGYPAAVRQRIAAIDLTDLITRTPVTDAWHSGEPVTVPPSASAPAALAVPIVGPNGSTGVLALELRAGEALGPVTVAKASFVAAQLGAVLSPTSPVPDDEPVADTSGDVPQALTT